MTALLLWSLGKGDTSQQLLGECPEYVVIPAGGYIEGASAEYDVLHHFTSLRIAAAAEMFSECEDTIFVMTGSSSMHRPKAHQASLMAELAISRGVDRRQIIFEPLSTNTKEHVVELLKLGGISPESDIAVVTSGWHVPRTRDVFDPSFKEVSYYPVWQARAPFQIKHLTPTTFALVENNILITEWLGRIWYAIR